MTDKKMPQWESAFRSIFGLRGLYRVRDWDGKAEDVTEKVVAFIRELQLDKSFRREMVAHILDNRDNKPKTPKK